MLPDNVQKAFEHYVLHDNVSAAAECAGVSRKTVYEWFKKYAPELEAMVRQEMNKAAVSAFSIILNLAKTSPNQQVRLHAAKDILNRAGYAPVEKKELSINGLKEEDLESELKKLLGMSDEDGNEVARH